MSRATPDDQLKFLLSCVRHSNNGKIDFVEVAEECGVVSKGAAAKRYERLLKANGIHPSGGTSEKLPMPALKQKSKVDIAKSAAAKRRKIEGDVYSCKVDDEDDFKPCFKAEPFDTTRIKSEPGSAFPSYSYQPVTAPMQQPFFPVRPISQFAMHNSYPSSYMSMPQTTQPRFGNVMPQKIYVPVSPTTPRLQSAFPNQNQRQPTPIPRPASAVSDEQIDSMFAEFCSQDMFKQPDFDAPLGQSTISTPNAAAVQPASGLQLSPRTVDSFANTSLDNRQQPSYIKVETSSPAVSAPIPVPIPGPTPIPSPSPTSTSTPTVKLPVGTDIKNSILITD